MGLFLLLCHMAGPAPIFAAEEQPQAGSQELANPFSDFVPFEDEYDIDEDERFMYFGRFFGVSLGTGLHRFGGNIGKVYNTALPVMDFRLIYFFDFRLAGQIGISTSSHAFSATATGPTEVSLLRLNGDLKYYFNTQNMSAAITSSNPYVILGISQTFRGQAFADTDEVAKDRAFAASAGFGTEFAIKPRKISLGVEGRVHQIYFKDRNDTTLAEDGIPDLTGNMYSFITSLIFFF